MSNQAPITALIIDAGNTKVRLAGWQGADQDPRLVGCGDGNLLPAAAPLLELGSVPTSGPEDRQSLLKVLAGIGVPFGDIPVVLTSVVPHIVDTVKSLWPEATVIDHHCEMPFRILSPEPQNIGPDRLCNVAAAAASGCQRALIVDAGTATTFDLLLDGEFAGGLIAPGMAFAAQCLGVVAARLDPVPFADCPLEPGLDTASAMQAGAFHTGLGGVEAVLTSLRAKYGPLPVVATGGLGQLLARPDVLWDPHWTLRGAAVLAGSVPAA